MNKIQRPHLLPYLGRFTLLFLVTYFAIGLPFLAFQSALPEFILLEGTFMEFLKDFVIGIPEIVTQMLVFSLIFFWWQRKAERKK